MLDRSRDFRDVYATDRSLLLLLLPVGRHLHDVPARVPARAGAVGARDLDGVRGDAAAGAGRAARRGRTWPTARTATIGCCASWSGGAWLGFVPMLFARSFTAIFVELGAVRDVRGRRGRAGRRLRGRARARRRHVRAAAAVGLRRVRRRRRSRSARCCRRAAVRGSAGAGRDVAGARLRVRRGASACAARASRRRARAAPTSRRCCADPRLRLLLAIAALHWICLAPYNVYFGVFLHDHRPVRRCRGRLAYSTGVVMEVFVLMTFHRLQVRFRLDDVAGGGVRGQRRALAGDRRPSARPGR